MRCIILLVLASTLFINCQAPSKKSEIKQIREPIIKTTIIAEEHEYSISESWFTQPATHDSTEVKSFDQQIITLHPKGLAEVQYIFFVLGNETDATAENLANWYKGYGSPKNMVFIIAEHRGYGQSITKEDQTLPTYVTKDQAMKDYHRLLPLLKDKYPEANWAGVGYSYGGALVLNYAYLYPDDFDVILSSSPPIQFPFLMPQYSEQVYENLGEPFTNRLAEHFKNLVPDTLYDTKWRDREMLSGLVGGLTQMTQLEALLPIVDKMSKQPTDSFIAELKTVLPPEGQQYATSRALRYLSYDMALTGKYNWYTWKWQQCFECGTFFYGLPFSYTQEEIIADCQSSFKETPAYLSKKPWPITEMIANISTPIVMVNGGKDPWLKIGLTPDQEFEQIKYVYDPDGNHVPDKFSEKLGKEIIQALLNELN